MELLGQLSELERSYEDIDDLEVSMNNVNDFKGNICGLNLS